MPAIGNSFFCSFEGYESRKSSIGKVTAALAAIAAITDHEQCESAGRRWEGRGGGLQQVAVIAAVVSWAWCATACEQQPTGKYYINPFHFANLGKIN